MEQALRVLDWAHELAPHVGEDGAAHSGDGGQDRDAFASPSLFLMLLVLDSAEHALHDLGMTLEASLVTAQRNALLLLLPADVAPIGDLFGRPGLRRAAAAPAAAVVASSAA
jgi:hypothetical protein